MRDKSIKCFHNITGKEKKKGYIQFISSIYQRLNTRNFTYEQYIWDIKLARLNECIEFIEDNFNNPTEEREYYYDYYLSRANKLADEILAYIK